MDHRIEFRKDQRTEFRMTVSQQQLQFSLRCEVRGVNFLEYNNGSRAPKACFPLPKEEASHHYAEAIKYSYPLSRERVLTQNTGH